MSPVGAREPDTRPRAAPAGPACNGNDADDTHARVFSPDAGLRSGTASRAVGGNMSDDPCWLPFGPLDEGQKGRAVTLVRSGVVLAALLVLAGCAEPIVLRPLHPEHQVIHRTPSRVRLSATGPERGRTLVQSSPALACPVVAAAPSEELAGPERRSA